MIINQNNGKWSVSKQFRLGSKPNQIYDQDCKWPMGERKQ